MAIWEAVRNYLISIWPRIVVLAQAHPFQIVACFLVICVLVSFIITYVRLVPSRGIKVSHGTRSDGINLLITNGTEHNLDNAYLAINWIKPEPEPARGKNGINYLKLLFGAPLPDPLIGTELFWEIDGDYLNRTIIESKRSTKSHSIKVESTGEAGFWVNKYTERRLLTQPSQRSIRPIIYFDIGEGNAEIQFGGTKPDGNSLVKIFELEYVYDGMEVKVKRIVQ